MTSPKIGRMLARRWCFILGTLFVFAVGTLLVTMGTASARSPTLKSVLIGVGTSLLASGVVMLLEVWREIQRLSLLGNVNQIIFDAGLHAIHDHRDLEEYYDRVSKARYKIDITGYSLNAFMDSHAEVVKAKATDSRAPMSVRLLLVNPDSEFSKNRARQENRDPSEFSRSVERVREAFGDCDNAEVRLLDAPLSTMIFRIDNVMYVGPQFYATTSKRTLTLSLKHDGWLFRAYEEEFDRMWHAAKPPPPPQSP